MRRLRCRAILPPRYVTLRTYADAVTLRALWGRRYFFSIRLLYSDNKFPRPKWPRELWPRPQRFGLGLASIPLIVLSSLKCVLKHKRWSSVNFSGAESDFCPKVMYEKITKCPNFTLTLPEKLQNIRIFMIFARKVNKIFEFHMTFARKKCLNFM